MRELRSPDGFGLFDSGLRTLDCGLEWLPPVMDPEPVRRVAPHGDFKSAVYVEHDFRDGACLTIYAGRDLRADFDPPPRQGDAITNRGVQRTTIAQGEDGGRGRRRTRMPQKRQAHAAPGALVGQETKQEAGMAHAGLQGRPLGAPFEEP